MADGIFDGIKIMVTKHLPDGEMYVTENTFKKMSEWFSENMEMVKMPDEDVKKMDSCELAIKRNICKCGGSLTVSEWQCDECNKFISNM